MRLRGKASLLIVSGLLASASAHAEESSSALAATAEHVVETNFAVGQAKQAFVGETMLSVKDYYKKPPKHDVWSITQPVKVDSGMFPITVVPGEYTVKGQEELGGVNYDAITAKVHLTELTTMSASSNTVEQTILIAPDGGIRGPENAWASGETSAADGIRAVRPDARGVDASRGYTNYELIYSGLSGGVLHIAYREHRPDDAAATAFAQDLTYDAGKSPIRFRNLSLAVDKATSEFIAFRVVSAGDDTSVQAAQAAEQK